MDLRNYIASHGEILRKSQFQSPLSLPKNKQPNIAFLSGRLTSSSVRLGFIILSRSSSVQRSFFHGDVTAITSWAHDVVNLARDRPDLEGRRVRGCSVP